MFVHTSFAQSIDLDSRLMDRSKKEGLRKLDLKAERLCLKALMDKDDF
jgi:hypothetical protein